MHFLHLYTVDYTRFNYIILLVTLGFLLFLFRVEPKPTYHPFDDLLRVDVEQLIDDDCWNPYIECVGPTLRYEANNFHIDYSIDGYEELDFVSERISYFPLDTLPQKYFIREEYWFRDTTPIPKIVLHKFEHTIQEFGFQIEEIFEDSVKIIAPSTKDTIIMEKRLHRLFFDSLIVRTYQYSVKTPLNVEQRVMEFFIEDY